eukprot:6668256-Alexandrium_andersonii.AAC.1
MSDHAHLHDCNAQAHGPLAEREWDKERACFVTPQSPPQLGTPPMLPQARWSIQDGRAAMGPERPRGLHPAERSAA